MKASRVTALGLVAAAAIWIASGHFMPHESAESRAAVRAGDGEAKKPFRVAVADTRMVPHSRKLVLSGRTEADRKVFVTARTAGCRDRAARAPWLVGGQGRYHRGAVRRSARGAGAAGPGDRDAEADRARGQASADPATAPCRGFSWSSWKRSSRRRRRRSPPPRPSATAAWCARPGPASCTSSTVEVGQAAFSFAGREIAQIVALDPMLAVVEVSERKLAGIKVGDPAQVRLVTGESAAGKIRFVAKTASLSHAHLSGRDRDAERRRQDPGRHHRRSGDAAGTARWPRGSRARRSHFRRPASSACAPSARTRSSASARVNVVEDEQTYMWVAGIPDGSRVIVQGQDFVREGQKVEAVGAVEVTSAAR